MQLRNIPGTDLSVSLMGFGNFTFGTNWWGTFTDEQAIALQNQAVDLGCNFFDTAPAYGNGRAEKLLKPTIAHAGRDRLIISTKFGYDFHADPGKEGGHRERKQDFSPKAIRAELEQSLQRMGLDVIDLYQAHNIKQPDFRDEVFATLEDLKTQGKIRHWGVALGPAIGWREEGHAAFTERGAATVQTVYNLYEQDLGREFGETAEHLGRGDVICRVPTNSGILDEEFASADHKFEAHDHRKFRDHHWLVYGLKKNKILRERFADPLGLTVQQFAIRWLASQPAVCSIEPNIIDAIGLRTYADACDGAPLPADMLADLRMLYANDFGLGDDAHPCDFKSSTTETGALRAGYEPVTAAG